MQLIHAFALAMLASLEPSACHGHAHHSLEGKEYALVLRAGRQGTTCCGHASSREIEGLKVRIRGDFLWFRHEGKAYVIRDVATLSKVRDLFKPLNTLGDQMSNLGEEMDSHGEAMEGLGQKFPVECLRAVFHEDEGAGEEGVSCRTLERNMKDLGRKMEGLGARMDALGKEMEKAGKNAEAGLRRVMMDSVANGMALPAESLN